MIYLEHTLLRVITSLFVISKLYNENKDPFFKSHEHIVIFVTNAFNFLNQFWAKMPDLE